MWTSLPASTQCGESLQREVCDKLQRKHYGTGSILPTAASLSSVILVAVAEARLPQEGEGVTFRLLIRIDGRTGCTGVEEAWVAERPYEVVGIMRTSACGSHYVPEPLDSTQRSNKFAQTTVQQHGQE